MESEIKALFKMENYTYQASGVNLENSNLLNRLLVSKLKSENFNNFAGVYKLHNLGNYCLTATTDGIGTKIIPLIEKKMFKTMAIDLAAMNLNDIICTGAKPLFFLDYLALNKLEPELISNFIEELNIVLSQYNCTLLGGETSELGDFIKNDMFDAAGFLVGLVKEEDLLKKENVKENDVIIGLKSSGAHSNGFSLIRKLKKDNLLTEEEFAKSLAPTTIYTKEILNICDKKLVSSLANITGGGILSNIERIIPEGLCAVLDKNSIPKLEIFNIIRKFVSEDEMYQTFNMGAGFCIIADEKNADKILEIVKNHKPFIFGRVEKSKNGTKARFKA